MQARPRTRQADDRAAFKPTRVLEIELEDPLVFVPSELPSGQRHEQALALVRLHSRPLGLVELAVGDLALSPEECAAQVWRALGARINEHLVNDGLSPVTEIPATGLRQTLEPRCVVERKRALAHAPFASVVIVTRDRTESLAACLDSIVKLNYPSFEVVVVDNAPSTNATKELLERRYGGDMDPQVRRVREDGSLAAARNRGLSEARASIVAFADDDVVVDRWWLLELVRSFDSDRIACVTGMIVPAELETQSQAWLEQYGGFNKGVRRRLFDLHDNRPNDKLFPYAAGMFGSGANMAFRTDVLRKLRGFDPATAPPSLPYGFEDVAAFFDVITAGYTLAYQPAALVHHRHHRDYASLQRLTYRYGLGLGAYLARAVVEEPPRFVELVRLLPRGLAYLLDPASPKNAAKRPDYPAKLTWVERKGLLFGPVAYLRARWITRGSVRPGPRVAPPH
jgi:GT2 family glycosyltransferase